MNVGKLISLILLIVVSLECIATPGQASSAPFSATSSNQPPVGVFPGEDLTAAALNINEEWRFNLYGSGIGASGLSVLDIDQDGKLEVVAGANSGGGFGTDDYWYVLRQNGANSYAQVWVSDKYASTITRIAAADADQDGVGEIYVALADRTVHIYSGRDFQETGLFTAGCSIFSLLLADANGDGASELIISNWVKIIAYDPGNHALLWETSAYGGQLAVGNVDGDPGVEIISSSGYVLDGATRAVEWYYPASGGFGAYVKVGDLDGDGMDEIVGAAGWYKITIYEADLKSPMWEIPTSHDLQALTLWDVDGDMLPEILYGEGQTGYIRSVDGQTHLETWKIKNPESGVTDIALGDVDNDGALEVLWGAGYSSTGPDFLFVADVALRQIEWQNDDLDGPLSAVDIGDVDDDGQQEILMATYSSDNNYGDGNILCFNATTHEIEWQIKDLPKITVWVGVITLRIADVDDDAQTEFVIATADIYDGVIQIYNGKTHALERQSASYSGVRMTAMEIGDVDGDGQTEIVVGQEREHTGATGVYVIVFDGATAAEEWMSVGLDVYWGSVLDIHLADTDGDGRVEIFTSIGSKIYAFDGVTHVLDAMILPGAYALTSADLDQDGIPSIVVGGNNGTLAFYNGQTFQLESTITLGTGNISCLSLVDIDLNGIPEWLVCASNRLSVYSIEDSSLLWQSKDLGAWPVNYNQISVGQVDKDGGLEVVFGSRDALYQFECETLNPLALSHMSVSSKEAAPGTDLSYEIVLSNAGSTDLPAAQVINPIPGQLIYVPNTLVASGGSAALNNGSIAWNGPLQAGSSVTISYQATVKPDVKRRTSVTNFAQIVAGANFFTVSAKVRIPALIMHLPLCSKGLPAGCGEFNDDFQNPSSGWPSGEDSYFRAEYTGGEYRLLGKQSGHITLIKAPTCKRENYVLETDARWEGTTGDSLGLVFGLDDDFTEYYLLKINTDYQEYALYYRGPSGSITFAGPAYHPAIESGTSTNHLKVIRSGNQIILEVNGVWLGAWNSPAASEPGNVGVFNAPYKNTSGSDARFDNFKVSILPGSPLLNAGTPELAEGVLSGTGPFESVQPYAPRR